jgi:hypothetical protein
MRKYNVQITESLQRIITVEAESEEDAIAMVESEYDLAHIVLDYSDFTGKDIEIYDCK